MLDANCAAAKLQRSNLLYDFYSGLLTPRQREVFFMHWMEDMSYSEIGAALGISPQAVQDMLKRATGKLAHFEKNLGLVEKLGKRNALLAEAGAMLGDSERDARLRGLLESMM